MTLCIVGRGKVGRSLHAALVARGVPAELTAGQRPVRSRADTFVLAVPDARIAAVAASLPLTGRSVVLHCAGARGPDELAGARARGAAVAGFHPLVSFAGPRTPLAGATFVAHGDERAVRRARALARSLGARCVAVPALGPAYHAAAALVANGGVALTFAGVSILRALGFDQRDAERALASLLASVAANVGQVGVPAALTGPVARGDAETVARHLRALSAHAPELARAYASVQPLVLACARAQGLDAGSAEAVARVISRGSRARPAPESPPPPRTRATRARARR